MEELRKEATVDPVTIIATLGIKDAIIVETKNVVYLSEQALELVAEYMDFKLPDGCTGFKKGGWWWLSEPLPEDVR